MSGSEIKTARTPFAAGPGLNAFAAELCRGVTGKVRPDDYLELVALLVTWATAERASRLPFDRLRRELNDAIAGAVASGLDVGYNVAGHQARLDTQPPGGKIDLV